MTDEHHYELESNWVREKIVTIEIEGKKHFEVATPPDFWPESPEGVLSPEDLFLASAVSCYGVSLSGVSKRFHAEFNHFSVKAEADLKKGEHFSVAIQQLISGSVETVIGMITDPSFGPLLMFGLGGIYVEVMKDVAFRINPLTDQEAKEMIESLRFYPLLTGIRGAAPR